MDILKSKTVDGIKKELLAYFIVYNLVRLVMVQAAKKSALRLNKLASSTPSGGSLTLRHMTHSKY